MLKSWVNNLLKIRRQHFWVGWGWDPRLKRRRTGDSNRPFYSLKQSGPMKMIEQLNDQRKLRMAHPFIPTMLLPQHAHQPDFISLPKLISRHRGLQPIQLWQIPQHLHVFAEKARRSSSASRPPLCSGHMTIMTKPLLEIYFSTCFQRCHSVACHVQRTKKKMSPDVFNWGHAYPGYCFCVNKRK